MNDDLTSAATAVLKRAGAANLKVATAESCTGGMIAAAITDIAGSSHVFERGFVTYSNEAKRELLDVPESVLIEYGAVSESVARAMVLGTLDHSHADIVVSVTGIAGPGGGSLEKPVGLVFIAAGRRGEPVAVERHVFPGDRAAVRKATALRALELLLSLSDG
jgi:nicotinamide-nucleotide amidase